jgi:hypothetical protein
MTIPQIRAMFQDNPTLHGILESTLPGYRIYTSARGEEGSRGSKIWSGRDKWYSYLVSRNVRFEPEEIDAEQVKSQADRERRQMQGTSAADEKKKLEYDLYTQIVQRTPEWDADPDALKKMHTGLDAYYHVHENQDGLSWREKVALINDTVKQFYPQHAGELQTPGPNTPDWKLAQYYEWWQARVYRVHNLLVNRGEVLKDKKGKPLFPPTGPPKKPVTAGQ